jgi:hypothetical protein
MSLDKNIAAFSHLFGFKNPEVIFPFALVNWETPEERNKFIAELVHANGGYRIGE